MSYSFLTACLTCGLFALLSTMNTRVLLSSIFFMADSVVRGNFTMLNRSNLKDANIKMLTSFKTKTRLNWSVQDWPRDTNTRNRINSNLLTINRSNMKDTVWNLTVQIRSNVTKTKEDQESGEITLAYIYIRIKWSKTQNTFGIFSYIMNISGDFLDTIFNIIRFNNVSYILWNNRLMGLFIRRSSHLFWKIMKKV